jgi:hypothetical protein
LLHQLAEVHFRSPAVRLRARPEPLRRTTARFRGRTT